MLEYYANKIQLKFNKRIDVYLISNDCKARQLLRFINHFIHSSLNIIYVYHDDSCHKNLCILEKIDSICYVTIVDSLASFYLKNEFVHQLNSEEFIHLKNRIVLCKSETNQQTTSSGCRYLALKNLSMVAKFQSFTSEVLKEQYLIRKEVLDDINFIYYRLPPMFMHLATSPK